MNGNVLLGDDLNEKKYNEDLYQTIVNHFEKHSKSKCLNLVDIKNIASTLNISERDVLAGVGS